MQTKRIQKDTFAVLGKAGEGATANSKEWIPLLWQDANAHFDEIAAIAKKDENGAPLIWGAMNDVTESNKMWGERGKYMVGCEVALDAKPPEGWQKWLVPAQTYLVAECTQDTYGEVLPWLTTRSCVMNSEHDKTVHPVLLCVVRNCLARLPEYAHIMDMQPFVSERDGRLHFNLEDKKG